MLIPKVERNKDGTFASARVGAPVGTKTIRNDHGNRRTFIKTAEPNTWRKLSQVVWESKNGSIPPGKILHHKDEDTLNDALENLELITCAEHLALHRKSFEAKRIANSIEAHRDAPWSTKSKRGLITGRHPDNCQCPIHCRKEGS